MRKEARQIWIRALSLFHARRPGRRWDLAGPTITAFPGPASPASYVAAADGHHLAQHLLQLLQHTKYSCYHKHITYFLRVHTQRKQLTSSQWALLCQSTVYDYQLKDLPTIWPQHMLFQSASAPKPRLTRPSMDSCSDEPTYCYLYLC